MSGGLISVIIPTFNRELYLDRCIQSVLDQKDVQTQIILVDDGSSDKSSQIIDKYAKDHNNIFAIHIDNQGAASARNYGLDEVTGDYISFVDSDDYLEPDALSSMLQALTDNDVDMVIGNAAIYEESGELSQTTFLTEKYQNNIITPHGAYSMVVDFNDSIASVIWARLYKKSLWEGVRFPAYRKSEDNYVMPLVLEKCRSIYALDKVVYNQTLTSTSVMRNFDPHNNLDAIDAYLFELDYLTKKDYYDIARYRFGQGTRMLIQSRKELTDAPSKQKLSSQYEQFIKYTEYLEKRANLKDKLRYSLFKKNLNIYGIVRKTCAKR